MTLSEYRSTLSWQGAIDLAPGLMELAEQLPSAEAMGLSLQIREAMVALPAAVASDLVHGTETRYQPLFALVAALELIDKVYPALDTSASKTAADQLAERLSGEDFDQSDQPAPAAAAAPEAEPAAETPVAPAPEPTHVQVQAAAPATNGEDNVQPNSV